MNDPIQTLRRDLLTIGLHPNRLRSQNFLVSQKIRDKLIHSAQLNPSDTVIEIGPGTGAVSFRLIQNVAHLILVEIDPELVQFLTEKLAEYSHVQIVHHDAVKWMADYLLQLPPGQTVKIVSNLPYSISSPILITLARFSEKIASVVLVLQREVASRIVASAGSKERGFLSVLIQSRFQSGIMSWVDRMKFWPPPEVESAVVKLLPKPDAANVDFQLLLIVSRVLFAHRRKTVLNNLRHVFQDCDVHLGLTRLCIPHALRPEQLTEEQILGIIEHFRADFQKLVSNGMDIDNTLKDEYGD